MAKQGTFDVIICTKGRPDDLRIALGSLLANSLLPKQVIIVDGGSSPLDKSGLPQMPPGTNLIVLRQKGNGLTNARNEGKPLVESGVLVFLDDDVVLGKGYFEMLMGYFDNPEVGGACGVAKPKASLFSSLKYLVETLFLIDWPRGGLVLPSGFNSHLIHLDKPEEVQWLSGCNMSYRTGLAKKQEFDEAYSGYGLMEDVDYSFRLSKTAKLVADPALPIVHNMSPIARSKYPDNIRMKLKHHEHFFSKNMKKSALNLLAYHWARLPHHILLIFLSFFA